MTIEELKDYTQVRTPDYAALANYVNRAKGEKRTMAQFAEDTGIGASTLSRIANMKIQKPLSKEVIVKIYERRANEEDTHLLEALARSNGLASPDYVERVNSKHRNFARRNDEKSRANTMKNAILAGVLAAGVPILKVLDGRIASNIEEINGVPASMVGRPCDFFMALGQNNASMNEWRVYLYPTVQEDNEEALYRRPVRMEVHWLMQRISSVFLRDAWLPESLSGVKISFAFADEQLFEGFLDAVSYAKVNNEMTALLLDPNDSYKVIREVWISGEYPRLSNISIFEMPAPVETDDEYEDFEAYEPENMEDCE